MATITTTGDRLRVALTTTEKVAGLLRDVEVPLAAIREVRVEPDALGAVRGIRAPGLAVPGRTKVGTWRRRGHRTVVVVRSGVPALRVRLEGAGPDELLVSTPDAEALARELAG
jgi:hypothetical protein